MVREGLSEEEVMCDPGLDGELGKSVLGRGEVFAEVLGQDCVRRPCGGNTVSKWRGRGVRGGGVGQEGPPSPSTLLSGAV